MPDNNELQLVVQKEGLEENKVQNLLDTFGDSFAKAKEVAAKARAIKVTSEDQVDEMANARKVRLELKDIRVNVENTRVKLKEQSLREGRAIDGISNVIKALIVPVEEYLEKQEKFAEEQKKIRDEEKFANRIELLRPYVEDVSVFNVREMSNETFEKLLANSKAAFQAQKDAEKKAEEDRIAREKKEREENERIRQENEKLKKEAEEAEKKRQAEREAQDKVLEEERKKKRDLEEKIQKEKEEREAKELEEKQAREKKEAEEAEAKRQASLAPDKNKLIALKNELESVQMPQVMTAEGAQAIRDIEKQRNLLLDFIVEKSNNL